MGNKGSKSKETSRDGKEHAAPSTSATGQVVSPTETVKKGNKTSWNLTQQTASRTELAMKANVEGASNMVDMNTSSPLGVNDSLEPAGECRRRY